MIPLKRTGQSVDSFLSSLGGLKETRLTATLGYLISRFPAEFEAFLGSKVGPASFISVEETSEGDRYDVLVAGGKIPVIIEGKIGLRQSPDQLLRYIKSVRAKYKCRPGLIVIDVGSHTAQSLSEDFKPVTRQVSGTILRRTWTEVAKICRTIVSMHRSFRDDRIAAAIAEDFVNHLEENQMTNDERPEVYMRELSTERTIRLFFKHGMYTSNPKYMKSAQGNLYFAPYFTRATADKISGSNLVPVPEGISYVSRITEMQVVPKHQMLKYLKARKDISNPTEVRTLMRGHKEKDILLLFLGKPHRAFSSPVTKDKLRRSGYPAGKGAMGSRSCTFEDLFAASQI